MPTQAKRAMRIVLAHDWLCGYRGGEGVLDRLVQVVSRHHELVDLFVMFDDDGSVSPAIDATPRTVSKVGKWPLASGPLRRWLMPFYPKAIRDLSRKLDALHERGPIDLIISSSSAAIKGLRPPYGVPHLCYCHSPPRYVWSQAGEYTRDSLLRSAGLKLFRKSFQRWDQQSTSADTVTRLIANSTYTADQVTRCYERSASVIYPPVRTEYFTPAIERMGDAREEYWLYVGALEPYKRVDLAIDAAKKLGQRLLIIGTGSMRDKLQAHARAGKDGKAARIRFAGRVENAELREHYRKARILLFPQVEDFGIVAVEAQACGLPVVARKTGGALDTVLDGVTGALFDEATVESLVKATIRCPRRSDAACRVNAERFSEQVFDAAILREIEMLRDERERK
jgi:glycosyltransferase involved in cell wall biosynthesis